MWLTGSGTYPSLFQNGNYFNNGVFTAPITGHYFISAQLRFDNINSQYIRLIGARRERCGILHLWQLVLSQNMASFLFTTASVTGADTAQLHSIRGNANYPFASLTISGVAQLKRGECVHGKPETETLAVLTPTFTLFPASFASRGYTCALRTLAE
jgi:hypothetical protein